MHIDSAFATARVIAEMTAVMTPELREEAATRIEALPGDDASREFYRTTALALRKVNEHGNDR